MMFKDLAIHDEFAFVHREDYPEVYEGRAKEIEIFCKTSDYTYYNHISDSICSIALNHNVEKV